MTVTVIVVDLIGVLLALIGFHLVFRQRTVRRWWARLRGRASGSTAPFADQDSTRYALRIAGMMILAFGVVIALFFTLVYWTLTAATA